MDFAGSYGSVTQPSDITVHANIGIVRNTDIAE